MNTTQKVQEFIDMLSKNKNVQVLMSEFNKISTELTTSREEALKQVQEKYKSTLHSLVEKQNQLEAQINDFRLLLAERVQTVAQQLADQVHPQKSRRASAATQTQPKKAKKTSSPKKVKKVAPKARSQK